MIDLAVLGLLMDQDLHGYELRKRLGELRLSRLAVSFGSLYPALARLERAGHLKAVTHQPRPTPPAPMSGSLAGELAAFRAHRRNTKLAQRAGRGGRGKKVYGLTDQGRHRLQELLNAEEIADDRDFALRLAFCHHLTPVERLELFRRRRQELVRQRDQQRRARSTDNRLNTYLRSLLERDTESLTADVAWLDQLIEAEQIAADEIQPGGNR
jgi:DNA-binding PadR family transcriptional regulator